MRSIDPPCNSHLPSLHTYFQYSLYHWTFFWSSSLYVYYCTDITNLFSVFPVPLNLSLEQLSLCVLLYRHYELIFSIPCTTEPFSEATLFMCTFVQTLHAYFQYSLYHWTFLWSSSLDGWTRLSRKPRKYSCDQF